MPVPSAFAFHTTNPSCMQVPRSMYLRLLERFGSGGQGAGQWRRGTLHATRGPYISTSSLPTQAKTERLDRVQLRYSIT
jgi:hypothetical protein